MTTVNWDHTVHYVNDLNNAIQTFQKNGLIAFKGGSHKQWGTYNALSYFGLSYIEFLGIEDRELAKNADASNLVVKDSVTLLPAHEVLSRVAIRTDDIDDTAAFLQANGLTLSPIIDGKRLDTHGQLIEWRMFTIAGDFQGLVYPFVIQWKGTDEERLESLTKSGIIQSHPAGNTTIQSGVFYVSDPSAVAAHWQTLFGLAVTESDETSVTLAIGDKSFIFKQGDANQLTTLLFRTESYDLKEKTIAIGQGEYVFL